MQRRLEIEVDETLERREARLQAVGRILLLAFLLAAALGLSGPGWWSSHALAKDGVVVRYDRAVHSGAPTPIELDVDPALVRDGRIELWLSQTWLDEVTLERVDPRPVQTRAEPGRTVLSFACGSSGQVRIHMEGAVDGVGLVRGELGVLDGPTFQLRQLAYP